MSNNKIKNKFTIQESFAISAGAGSGKTYTLSRRYINAILGFDFFKEDKAQVSFIEEKDKNKADVTQIVTITYTKAAALEMKERIFSLMQTILSFLENELQQSDGDYESIYMGMNGLSDDDREYIKERLSEALQNSNNAMIETIHVFCLTLLKENSDIAKIDTKITMIDDAQKEILLAGVLLSTMEKNKEEVLELFQHVDRYRFESLSKKYLTNSKFRTSFDKFVKNNLSSDTLKEIYFTLFPLPKISQELLDEIESRKDSEATKEWLDMYIENLKNFKATSWGKVSEDRAPSLKKDSLLKASVKTKATDPLIKAYQHSIDEKLEIKFKDILEKIQIILQKTYQYYMKDLVETSRLDFDGILTLTRDIIKHIDTDFEYIMVDEFQDTNSLQIDIINTISKDKDKNLFVVGDSKQSIYAFQGAELEVFNNAVGSDAVCMKENYRSDKDILDFVNLSFFHLFKQSDEGFISTNYEATFTNEDKLSHKQKDNNNGSVEFMISVDENAKTAQIGQWKNIAKFIKGLKDNSISGYEEVKKKLAEDEKAIGILFDSKTQMHKLKIELNKLGIECKVSGTDKFYKTKEVNDIFIVLKASEVLKVKQLKNKIDKKNAKESTITLYEKDKFYIAGALRSNILRYDDGEIVEILKGDIENIMEIFQDFIDAIDNNRISMLIKYLVDDSKLLDIYNYTGDIAQRSANIEKLIKEAIVFEEENSSSLKDFLKELERFIYFSRDLKVNEAFYKSKSVESVELCTIHSTKGLDYPMVILAQSEKNVLSKSAGDMGLNFNTFALNIDADKQEYGAVGFKIYGYEPLIYRILKKINRNKDEAERKRLLYVALTRAKHNIIVSGSFGENKETNKLSSINDSYLLWLSQDGFEVTQQELRDETPNEYFKYIDKSILQNITGHNQTAESFERVTHENEIVVFNEDKKVIASATKEHVVHENIINQATIGTKIHSILERYWDRLDDENIFQIIYFKYAIFDEKIKEKIKEYLDNFKTTDTYKQLKSGVKYHFELELHSFRDEIHTQGIIDLVYFDKEMDGWVIVDFKSNNIKDKKDLIAFAKESEYDKQLSVYQELCELKDMKVIRKLLLFLQDGSEVEF